MNYDVRSMLDELLENDSAGLSLDPDAHLTQIKEIYTGNVFVQPSQITYDDWIEMVYGVE